MVSRRTLVINEMARIVITEVIERARKHPMPVTEAMAIAVRDPGPTLMLHERPAATQGYGRRRNVEQIELFDGYQCAFSFEEQPHGIVRHLSIAVNNPGNVPMPAAVQMICKEFGFREFPPLYGRVWVEEFRPGEFAVNVAELVDIPKEATAQ